MQVDSATRQVRNREDLFDLFVDLDASTFKISEHAQNEFLLCRQQLSVESRKLSVLTVGGSVHKDMANYLMEAAASGDADDQQVHGSFSASYGSHSLFCSFAQDIIKGTCVKTKQVLAKLDSLKSDHGLGALQK